MPDKKPNLEERLDNVSKTGKNYMQLNNILDQYKKDPSNPEIFNAFIQYGGKPLPEEEVKLLRGDMYKTRGLMEKCLEEDQKGLIEKTSNNISDIISQFSTNELANFAASIPDKDKKYLKVAEALEKAEKGAIEQARKAYAQTFDNKVWRKFMEEEATEEEIVSYASRFVNIKQNQFISKFLSEKEVDGKKKSELDKNKLFTYIGKQILSYKPEEKQGIYLQLGEMYTRMILKKEKEAKESKEEKKVA